MIAIDPGTRQSAYCILRRDGTIDYSRLTGFGKMPNDDLRLMLRSWDVHDGDIVVEGIASYGMPVGAEVFETCVWVGRFIEAHGGTHRIVYRRDVKLHLCGDTRAKDANVRQSLIDRYGPGKDKAVGTKKAPGPLYGFRADMWAALAVAVTAQDTTPS